MTLVISSTFLLARPKVPSCKFVSQDVRTVWGGAESEELSSCALSVRKTYSLLRKTAGTLVLGVTEQFNDALLVGGKTIDKKLVMLSSCANTFRI